MISVENLTKQYKAGKPVFKGISETFESGRCIGIFGPNGSGKTTFLRILSVNSFPTSGTVLYNGINIHEEPGKYLGHLGLVHDEESLPLHLTAGELLEWILRKRKLWDNGGSGKIQEIFDRLSLPEYHDPMGTYSTGMKKKAQIAAAFIVKPDVLIMDEPLRGLDQTTRGVVTRMIGEARGRGALIFMSSHSAENLSELFDDQLEFPMKK
ncbi:ABC transporter ATP-binding protein [Rhodohalobacter mucosus]|uniref:ABC transporter ATP-binding protein n=1 Tax=Rhodohalobacter mucosus TaxID=2079485 RepID=A0A316TWJ3_9BACT|nr:ABC transporter ATP-binding protein [Rhodohalobacter mucosus]PWN06932.1 ABC transporter ATP-binding protein [Rhodohalobacter mucosus]